PLKVGFVVIDIVTALQAASTIKDHLLALARGLRLPPEKNNVIMVEQSMAKTSALLMTGQYINTYVSQKDTFRDGNRDLFVAPFSFYKTKDGMISIGIIGDPLFATFCDRVLGSKVLAHKYPTNQIRLENPEFDKELEQILMTRDSEYWINACKEWGIVCTKVNTVLEMLEQPFAKKMITQTQSGVPIIADSATSSAFAAETLRDAPGADQDRKAISALVAHKSDLPGVTSFQELYQFFLRFNPSRSPLLLYRHDSTKHQVSSEEMDDAWQHSFEQAWPHSPGKGTLKAKL
ncbi:MAG: CoA transferase, partial [Proteobacteria bacterium]|nr:CoA transferase [Pseudomonadota bacterium]